MNLYENKTTSELLDLLCKLEKKSEKSGLALDDEYDVALAELRKRPPFNCIIGKRQDDGYEPSLDEKMDEVQDDIKKLKRHKHDPHSGDVMTRI
jgi:hypothetical protein